MTRNEGVRACRAADRVSVPVRVLRHAFEDLDRSRQLGQVGGGEHPCEGHAHVRDRVTLQAQQGPYELLLEELGLHKTCRDKKSMSHKA